MNEEEKDAYNYLEKYIKWETYGERNLERDINTILNLINKQQKEIEELNKENTRQQELIGNIHQKWKDKIKEKIKELESHIWKDGYMTKFDKYAIHYLKELLGETND